jgi:hypothetical protein
MERQNIRCFDAWAARSSATLRDRGKGKDAHCYRLCPKDGTGYAYDGIAIK